MPRCSIRGKGLLMSFTGQCTSWLIHHRKAALIGSCTAISSCAQWQLRSSTDAQEAGVPLLQEELDAERSAAEAIFGMLQRHPMVPEGLGSGRSLMWHELHALYHSFFLECGDPALLSELAASIISLTSDRGTEAGFAGAHPAPFNMFFPHFDQAQLEFQEDGGMGIVAVEAAPAAAVPVPPPPPPVPSLSMQSALPTPGCLHIVHNATHAACLEQCHTLKTRSRHRLQLWLMFCIVRTLGKGLWQLA